MTTLATIGYEDAPQAEIIDRLVRAGVKVLIDVRAVASSRRAGFSKTLLAASLADAGIEYVHLRDLGTPKAGRDAARKGHIDEMHAIFEAHMEEPAAQLQFEQAAAIVADRPAALLCYEADAACCHRRILADRLVERLGVKVADL